MNLGNTILEAGTKFLLFFSPMRTSLALKNLKRCIEELLSHELLKHLIALVTNSFHCCNLNTILTKSMVHR